ncbi:MAG: hypothetical protein WBL25_20060 [Anaerolineales bacterium]
MTRIRIVLSLIVLLFTTLACTMFVGGPDYPEGTIPVSAEAVQSLRSQIEAAVLAGAQGGEITLLITEEQITSYIAFRLAAQENPVLKEPQVFLRDGQMQVYGKVERGYFIANVLVALNVSVDELGQPRIEIATADFGPFPVPDGLKQSLTAIITEAYTGSLGPVATGFRLDRIDIANGLMTVTGRIK